MHLSAWMFPGCLAVLGPSLGSVSGRVDRPPVPLPTLGPRRVDRGSGRIEPPSSLGFRRIDRVPQRQHRPGSSAFHHTSGRGTGGGRGRRGEGNSGTEKGPSRVCGRVWEAWQDAKPRLHRERTRISTSCSIVREGRKQTKKGRTRWGLDRAGSTKHETDGTPTRAPHRHPGRIPRARRPTQGRERMHVQPKEREKGQCVAIRSAGKEIRRQPRQQRTCAGSQPRTERRVGRNQR